MSGDSVDGDELLGNLQEILDQPELSILPLLHPSSKDKDVEKKKDIQEKLVKISQFLFSEIEGLANRYHELKQSKNEEKDEGDNEENIQFSLSGLSEMFLPPGDEVDMETIWGQVELQNTALNKLLKKSAKKLSKAPEDIVLLDMEGLSSSDDDSSSEDESDSDEEAANEIDGEDEDGSDGSDDDADSDTKRMRERMERAMRDMDSDEGDEGDSDDDDEEDDIKNKQAKSKKSEQPEEELFDPVAEDLKDGFFDLNEMEDFADEEEDFLPDEAFGQAQKEKKKSKKEKKSFHQRQRDGDLGGDSDDDDDSDDLFESEEDEPVKRKKYRADDEIDALFTLYQDEKEEDDEDNIVNMTAADFFGKPKMKYYQKYYKNKPKKNQPAAPKADDDDSWGEYDFDKEDDATGWRDEKKGKGADDMEEDDDSEDGDGDDDSDDGESSEDDEESEEEVKEKMPTDDSRFGKQQAKLRKQTEQLENEMLSEKPWQMTGETKSTSRPVNSLLEGTPEFEMASKQAPVITVEHTADLEEVIKKRILAEDWDDVVPRELPDVGWHKKRGELPEVSQEKSKLGLGELYEREYLKKAVGYDVDATEKQTAEEKAKDEMKALFANLCSKLDALSNYHFAPRPIADEAEVRAVTAPAIAMEEVLPLHVSDARGVAPEEVYATKRGREGILRAESEMDQNDRKRLRLSKKAARRKARKEKLADEKLISRLQPGLGLNNPYEKRKMREDLARARSRGQVTTGQQDMDNIKFGSSGTFFKKLQAEAQGAIQGGASAADQGAEKKGKAKSSAFKL